MRETGKVDTVQVSLSAMSLAALAIRNQRKKKVVTVGGGGTPTHNGPPTPTSLLNGGVTHLPPPLKGDPEKSTLTLGKVPGHTDEILTAEVAPENLCATVFPFPVRGILIPRTSSKKIQKRRA